MNKENVIKAIDICLGHGVCNDCPYCLSGKGYTTMNCRDYMLRDALALLKEQEERMRKFQKDKDKLCLEVSEWKHKFHDAPPKFVSQGVVDQIRWERDIALSQLEQIGKGLGSKMDDIVALLKEQRKTGARKRRFSSCPSAELTGGSRTFECSLCNGWGRKTFMFCPHCGAKMET